MNRKYLMYVPTVGSKFIAKLFAENRLFDFAINDFKGAETPPFPEAEIQLHAPGLKFRGLHRNLEAILDHDFHYIALFDDDIDTNVESVNRLFLTGESLGLDLWQPAHAPGSFNAHSVLSLRLGSFVRVTDFVEIMCPFLSRRAFETVSRTFHFSESGWGLDYLWPRLLNANKIGIIDAIPIRHTRPSGSGNHVGSKGKTSWQELEEVRQLMETNAFSVSPPPVERSAGINRVARQSKKTSKS